MQTPLKHISRGKKCETNQPLSHYHQLGVQEQVVKQCPPRAYLLLLDRTGNERRSRRNQRTPLACMRCSSCQTFCLLRVRRRLHTYCHFRAEPNSWHYFSEEYSARQATRIRQRVCLVCMRLGRSWARRTCMQVACYSQTNYIFIYEII